MVDRDTQVIRNNERANRYGAGILLVSEWEGTIRQQCGKCAHCKVEPEHGLTIDHIIPMSAGGANAPFNIQGLCRDCNHKKHERIDRQLQELYKRLRAGQDLFIYTAQMRPYDPFGGDTLEADRAREEAYVS